jgi:hypothetical protein
MPFLVRKIELSKWKQRKILRGEPPSAEAITLDLKAIGNKLSAWEIDNVDELEEAVLAIVSGGTNLETIDIVMIDIARLEAERLRINQSQGPTKYSGFSDRHRDIIGLEYDSLEYDSLGRVARCIIESMRFKNESVSTLTDRFTVSRLRGIFEAGIAASKIRPEDLHPDIRKYFASNR